MSDENTEIELRQRMDEALKDTLLHTQGYSAPQSLCNQNPERWMYLASQLTQGRSRTDLFKKENISHNTTRRIEAELALSPHVTDLKQELSVQRVQNINVGFEIQSHIDGSILKDFEPDDEGNTRFDSLDPLDKLKAKKENTISNKLEIDSLTRMRGDNTQKIEVTHKNVDFETMLKAAQEARDKDKSIKAADVVELENEAELTTESDK